MPALIDQVSTRDERREETAQYQADKQRITDEATMLRNADARIPQHITDMAGGEPFWGDRYQVRPREAGRRATYWDVVDTRRDTGAQVEWCALKRDAVARASALNMDPTANWNGEAFPSVHNRSHPKMPTDPCDCMDGRVRDGTPNVCRATFGTYCASHGRHDMCPRLIRGIALWSDLPETDYKRLELERRRRDLERSLAILDIEFSQLISLEALGERYGA